MINERKMAKELLNAVWEDDGQQVEMVLAMGADPNWIFNGYPILMHAIYRRNWRIAKLLIDAGAENLEEALGFALDRGIGEMVSPLAYLGVVPKPEHVNADFGLYPSRYSPLRYELQHPKGGYA